MTRRFGGCNLYKFNELLLQYRDRPDNYWLECIDWLNCTETITKDLEEINFSTENMTTSPENHKLEGINQLDNGMMFLGVTAGGDWELPIFFIIYYDGKELRGYIPKEGNCFNTKTNAAWGNEADYGLEEIEDIMKIFDTFSWDESVLVADIKANILPPEDLYATRLNGM